MSILKAAILAAVAAGTRVEITNDEYLALAQIVECEAGADTFDGKAAIATGIWDYASANDISVTEAMSALQCYTYTREITEESFIAVGAVFFDGYRPTEEPIIWWLPPWYAEEHPESFQEACTTCIGQIGAHRFYKPRD